MKYLIDDALVVTMDQNMEILRSCDVLIDNGIISAVGKLDAEQKQNASVINASGKLLMPGLINGHCHVPMTLMRNFADDMDLQTWLFNYIFPAEEKLTSEDIYWGALLGIMEMVATGTTCFIDMYDHMNDLVRAAEESGIRAQLSRGVTNFEDGSDFSEHKGLNEAIDFYRQWNGAANGRITGAFAPHAVYTCSTDFIKAVIKTAQKFDAPIHVHLDETRVEHEDCLAKHRKTPTRYLYDLGLFDRRTVAAHCVWITDEDISLLKDKNVTIAHNPTSNLKLASGVAPVPQALSKGVNVIIGTDGASSNNNLNMFEEIHLASLIHKGVNHDPLLVNAETALRMATTNGAAALGIKNLGIIEEGAKADLILVDMDKPHIMPVHNILSALAYSVQGSDVYMTMVDGRILFENGEFKTIDKEKVRYNIQKCYDRLFR
ncbi:MAG: amidohydrolase [Clostridiaceae bacterium]|jgi:5-methylthioadenosine/S-adenosylhomocysteine deaminase|nr:amidohydrolase [Clostridiaceae bacterium]